MHRHVSPVAWMLSGGDGWRPVEDRLAIHRAELRLVESARSSHPSRVRSMMEHARAAVLPPRATDPACCPA